MPSRGRDTPDETIVKLKICLVGDSAVGKTSLVRRYVKDQFNDEYLKTVGAKVAKKTVTIPWNGTMIRVDMILWDIAGMGGMDSVFRRDYLWGTQGVLAVCDATDDKTISRVGGWVKAVRELAGDVPIQVVINKADADDASVSNDPRVPRVDSNISWIRTSAKTGDNVERAFYELAKSIVLEKMIPKLASRESSLPRPQ
ncbi:MAG: Rab family GTPase [Thermoplasmata archaeon]